jgi:hypothetical protein
MPYNQPFEVTGFHSCDKEVGLKVLNGAMDLAPSTNTWDWLGSGVYFWEQDPMRAVAYAIESSKGVQFNKTRIRTPFVLGAIIEFGKCLNLVETGSLEVLKEAYKELAKATSDVANLPLNKGNNRALDCAVFKYIHEANNIVNVEPYTTIRCAFQEGGEVYPGSSIKDRLHIQVCVIDTACIKGYFLPRPILKFNPHLNIAI